MPNSVFLIEDSSLKDHVLRAKIGTRAIIIGLEQIIKLGEAETEPNDHHKRVLALAKTSLAEAWSTWNHIQEIIRKQRK